MAERCYRAPVAWLTAGPAGAERTGGAGARIDVIRCAMCAALAGFIRPRGRIAGLSGG
jgi:hypothetical protein